MNRIGLTPHTGWNVDDRSQVIEEYDIIVDSNLIQEASTPYAGHQYSDCKSSEHVGLI